MNKTQNRSTIGTYLDKLKEQINENPNLKYVLLRLDDSNVDKLSNLLKNENTYPIEFILKNYNIEKYIKDSNGDKWVLCITGFKHGAKKDSPRKIGLLAYRYGSLINFKTMVFYDSSTYDFYNRKEDRMKDVNYIKSIINTYINTNEYGPNVNYIKPERKIKK